MSKAYDDACELARELGIPEDNIDEVIDKAELCCSGPYGDGPCAENTRSIIESEAERFQVTDEDLVFSPEPKGLAVNHIATCLLMFLFGMAFATVIIFPYDEIVGNVTRFWGAN